MAINFKVFLFKNLDHQLMYLQHLQLSLTSK